MGETGREQRRQLRFPVFHIWNEKEICKGKGKNRQNYCCYFYLLLFHLLNSIPRKELGQWQIISPVRLTYKLEIAKLIPVSHLGGFYDKL